MTIDHLGHAWEGQTQYDKAGVDRQNAIRRARAAHPSDHWLEDWGKLVSDVPDATAILDRFLHHAAMITITGKSYRLRGKADKEPPRKNPEKPGGACDE